MAQAQPTTGRKTRDLTTGSLGRLIVTLAAPSVAEMMLFSATELVHAFWLGRAGGVGIAAASMANTLRIVLISPMMGLSGGGMAIVARHIGAREERQADRAVMQTILLVILFVLPLIALGNLFGHTFLRWMGAQGALLDEAWGYLRIILAGLFFMECLPTMSGVIRGAGHPEQTLRINMVSIATVLILEPLLVLGLGPFPTLGVRGAAWASVLGSAAGVVTQFIVLKQGLAGVRLHLADLRPDCGLMGRILKIALPTSAQRLSPSLANALLMRLIAHFGTEVLTAYSVVMRLYGFLQCLPFGTGNATSAIVGQNLGAQKPERAQRATLSAAGASLAISALGTALLAFWPGPFLGLFQRTSNVVAWGAVILRYLAWVSLGTAWWMVIGAALTGAGDALAYMWINIGALWLVQMPLCWAFSRLAGLGATGIWLGMIAGTIASIIALTWRFQSGRWKAIAV